MNNKFNKVNSILNMEEIPDNRTKIEKKEKGLYEKTSNSTILLTEDNKMMLND